MTAKKRGVETAFESARESATGTETAANETERERGIAASEMETGKESATIESEGTAFGKKTGTRKGIIGKRIAKKIVTANEADQEKRVAVADATESAIETIMTESAIERGILIAPNANANANENIATGIVNTVNGKRSAIRIESVIATATATVTENETATVNAIEIIVTETETAVDGQ